MLWLVAPAVIVAILFIAGLRKAAVALLVVTIGAGTALYLHNRQLQQRAASRISHEEVALTDVAVRRTFDSSYEVSGKIGNKSTAYRLDGITLHLSLRNCPESDAASCVPIGDTTVNVAVTVPPKESRRFIGSFYIPTEKRQEGALASDYRITAVVAKRQ